MSVAASSKAQRNPEGPYAVAGEGLVVGIGQGIVKISIHLRIVAKGWAMLCRLEVSGRRRGQVGRHIALFSFGHDAGRLASANRQVEVPLLPGAGQYRTARN